MTTCTFVPNTLRGAGRELRHREGKISALRGARLLGTDVVRFQGPLAERGIARNYSVSDLHDDLAALNRMLGV